MSKGKKVGDFEYKTNNFEERDVTLNFPQNMPIDQKIYLIASIYFLVRWYFYLSRSRIETWRYSRFLLERRKFTNSIYLLFIDTSRRFFSH